ncbi:MAG: hypothetical protein NVSMB62_14830 [Acidobacteriaceae bacterium]
MQDLIQIVDAALADAARRSGSHLACRPGCSQCCIGVFPLSRQDAGRLREGMERVAQTDPALAQRILERAAASLRRIEPQFPGNRTSGILDENFELSPEFENFGDDEACPVLDPSTGTCDLYTSRPIVCRTFGPPLRTPGDGEEINLATCELCFTYASPDEIAACELDPTLTALEAASNRSFNLAQNLDGETIVAYALRSSNMAGSSDLRIDSSTSS